MALAGALASLSADAAVADEPASIGTPEPPGARQGSARSELLIARAQAAYGAERYDEARDLFAEAVAADPHSAEAHYGLGLTLARSGRWEEAARHFQDALALQFDFTEAERALGTATYERGLVAFNDRQYGSAAPLFQRAATLHPTLAGRAHYYAGLAYQRAGNPADARLEFEAAEKGPDRQAGEAAREALSAGTGGFGATRDRRWGIRLATGADYDSNVVLQPTVGGVPLPSGQSDGAALFGAAAHYDLLSAAKGGFRLDYSFYQSLHGSISEFDQRGNRVWGTASYALRPELWIGLQGGFNHYVLGSSNYLQEPFVLPFVTAAQGRRGTTQILYRHGELDYLSFPFDSALDRDGPSDAAGVSQFVYFGQGAYVTFGYQFVREVPRGASGSDFAFNSHQGNVGVLVPAWWKTTVEVMYTYRYYDYLSPNSAVDFKKSRVDSENRFYAGVKRNLTKHLSLTFSYLGTWNNSNINLYEYDRNVASVLFEFVY